MGLHVISSGYVKMHLWVLQCRENVLLTIRFLDGAKFTTLTTYHYYFNINSHFQLQVQKYILCHFWHWNYLMGFTVRNSSIHRKRFIYEWKLWSYTILSPQQRKLSVHILHERKLWRSQMSEQLFVSMCHDYSVSTNNI